MSVATNPIAKILHQQGFVVLDGALATELERHGADLNDPLWSARCLLDAPDLIRKVHDNYLLAGADVVSSATYQASQAGFEARGMSAAQAKALMRRGVELALTARDAFWEKSWDASSPEAVRRAGRLCPLVAVSLGPFGACLHDGSEYHGVYRAGRDEIMDFHRSRLDALTGLGADLLAFETIPSLDEAEMLLKVLGDFPGETAWLSFSCRDGDHLSHGERFDESVALVASHAQIVAVGANCTAPQHIGSLLHAAKGAERPLLVYPNSGERWLAGENRWTGEGGSPFEPWAWYQAGARMMGGCCRTRPSDIAAIRQILQENLGQ